MKLCLRMSGFKDYDKEIIVTWDKLLLDFPKFAKYDDRYWGWIFHDQNKDGRADHDLLFSEHLKTAMPIDMYGNPFPVTDLALMFNLNSVSASAICECGSDKFGGGRHSDYCPKYEKT